MLATSSGVCLHPRGLRERQGIPSGPPDSEQTSLLKIASDRIAGLTFLRRPPNPLRSMAWDHGVQRLNCTPTKANTTAVAALLEH
jgi:hypothetical protein